jgi:hypothetical protein
MAAASRPAALRRCLSSAQSWLALSDDGNTLAINEPVPPQGDLIPSGTRSYIYQRSGSTWSQQASLEPSNFPSACQQPCSASVSKLALSADGSLLAGSINFYSQATRKYMSAVVIYARNGATWSQQALLETGDRSADIMALARDGKTLAVNQGAKYRSESVPSFALVFTQQSNGTWSQQASIPVGIWYFMDIAAGAYSSMQLSDDGNTLAVLASNRAEDLSVLSRPPISRAAHCRETWVLHGIVYPQRHGMAASSRDLARLRQRFHVGAGPRWQCPALRQRDVHAQQRRLGLPLTGWSTQA